MLSAITDILFVVVAWVAMSRIDVFFDKLEVGTR